MNQYISLMQQIVKEYDPDINVRTGSVLYYLILLPAATIYEYINSLINILFNNSNLVTAENKEPLLSNFGVPQYTGTKGVGELELRLNDKQDSYFFPKGTIFTSEFNDIVLLTEDTSVSNTISLTLKVETETNTDKIYFVGEKFTCSIYGTLIESCEVKTQIGGGKSDENIDDWQARIMETLSQTTTTSLGVYNAIKKQFPKIIDIKCNDRTVYIKSPLTTKTKKIKLIDYDNSRVAIIEDNIAKITYCPYKIKKIVTTQQGTSKEKNLVYLETSTIDEVEITYYSPYLVPECQSFVDNKEVFPIGFSLLIKQANPIFISGEIKGIGSSLKVQEYILNTKIGSLTISDILVDNEITKYELPIYLTMEDTYRKLISVINNEYLFSNSAYYTLTNKLIITI